MPQDAPHRHGQHTVLCWNERPRMELLCCSVYSTVSCLLQEAGRCKREQGAVRCSAVASMSWDMRNASDSNASKASTCSMHGGQTGRRAGDSNKKAARH